MEKIIEMTAPLNQTTSLWCRANAVAVPRDTKCLHRYLFFGDQVEHDFDSEDLPQEILQAGEVAGMWKVERTYPTRTYTSEEVRYFLITLN